MAARVEHVNLVVKNLGESVKFLRTALPEWKVRGRGESNWYGRARCWLHFGTETSYLTLNDGSQGQARDLRGYRPGLAHVGLVVDDVAGVTERLLNAGYTVGTYGADHPYRKTVYFIGPSGVEFEFIEYFATEAHKRNLYGGETSPIRRIGTA